MYHNFCTLYFIWYMHSLRLLKYKILKYEFLMGADSKACLDLLEHLYICITKILLMWDVMLSWLWIFKLWSSGLWCHVVIYNSKVLKEMLVSYHITTWHHSPKDHDLKILLTCHKCKMWYKRLMELNELILPYCRHIIKNL